MQCEQRLQLMVSVAVMEKCIICLKDDDTSSLVKLREKGSQGINKASREREGQILASAGQFVHQECRKSYTNPTEITKTKRQQNILQESNIPTLRSKSNFSHKDHCLFYDFQKRIEQVCNDRDDEWAVEVRGRLECVGDLHAADALYHQTCSVNFRTSKKIPKAFSPDSKGKENNYQGRPAAYGEQFLKIVDYLKQHEDEQITIAELVNKMNELCGEQAYSSVYMKKKLRNHFGENIIITDICGKISVVTLRDTASCVLQEFYHRPTYQNPDDEKKAIIDAAAKLIKSDIRSLKGDKENYPLASDVSSLKSNLQYVPESLSYLLETMFAEKDSKMKIASIGQAIVQASRPRVLIAPLQIGLGIQLHHNFASRFLVSTLNNLGFCSSYQEIQKFESSAALTQGVDIPGEICNSFIQFVADNVDHNVRTLDGNNTFHGMGIIAGITPGTKRTAPIPRISVSSDDINSIAKVNIQYYKPQNDFMTKLNFSELRELRGMDKTACLDLLSLVVWPLKNPTPGWSGIMQMIHKGEYPGKSTVVFLPMIDMNSSDMSCIYSTLLFVSNQAHRYNRTPVLTFDQPLYWKALTIIQNEHPNSQLKSVVLRLGAFHTEMSFLGCIGHIMRSSGLQEILELIYAPNAVTHMLSGKAVARAIRGHMLVDTALHSLLVSKIFNFDFPADENEEGNINVSVDDILSKAADVYTELLEGTLSISSACDSAVLQSIKETIHRPLEEMKKNRTSKLWLQYTEMMQILRQFIKAERTGDWELHLKSVKDMLPYLAASGHNLYTKSAYVYLMMMQQLEIDHPEVFAAFKDGHHVMRRSDRYWAGLSSDLMIEQVLMRSVKTAGGLTRGRGMGESQRSQWLLSMPACADMNQAIQELTGVGYYTSDQHKEESIARQKRDREDIMSILTFMKERSPFTGDSSLRNIETGVTADSSVNVDNSKDVGTAIIESLVGQNVIDYTFKKKNQVITLNSKTSIKVDGELIQVDPQLLFQRCTTIANGLFEDISEIFKYELCSVPSSLFDNNGLPRQANKSILADSIWDFDGCGCLETGINVHHVLDGGSLIHRIPWTKGNSFNSICQAYIDYVKSHYSQATIVFDGYPDVPTVKDITHIRRSKGCISPKINFSAEMPCKTKKDAFLSNEENKQRFINLLSAKFEASNYAVVHAFDDADLNIVQTAVSISEEQHVVVIGEDTDLLVLLCYHAMMHNKNVYFKSEPKQSIQKIRIWDIKKTKKHLGEAICRLLPFIHAFSGCDTTSRVFGLGKGALLKKVKSSAYLQDQSQLFLQKSSKDQVVKAGEEVLVDLYGGVQSVEGLDLLRYRKFASKVVVGNVFVQVHTLPPTSDAAKLHSMRTFYQTQIWIGEGHDLDPNQWGWYTSENKLMPVRCLLPPAPQKLLKVIRCNCKQNCDSRRCSCRKQPLFELN
ncbi:unnamed protein product [Mytilus edulis]|uniref:Uncharacterized protein n=1 Tax=Mytilus edulis TaxID=6550 RepID=A0A8S3R3S9_MYTED|nr:unnamed protein product [Mytilus edulis]